MNSPFQRLSSSLANARTKRASELPHPAAGRYEFISFLLMFPSLLVFLPGFVFVLINFLIAKNITKDSRLLFYVLIASVNGSYFLSCILLHTAEYRLLELPIIAELIFPITLMTFGILAVKRQTSDSDQKSV